LSTGCTAAHAAGNDASCMFVGYSRSNKLPHGLLFFWFGM
jgi:hypothetical protein